MALSANNAGRVSAIRDSLGNMTRYAYDENGFLSRMINPSDQLRTFTHEHGRLLSIVQENGQTYTFGGDTNFYRYAGNDPVNFIDDSGFSAHATGGAVNHSQQMLSKTTAGTNPIPPKPKPSNGGGASAKMNCGVKVAGGDIKIKPMKYLRFVFHTAGDEPTNSGKTYKKYLDVELKKYKTLHEIYLKQVTSHKEAEAYVNKIVSQEKGAFRVEIKEVAYFSDLSHLTPQFLVKKDGKFIKLDHNPEYIKQHANEQHYDQRMQIIRRKQQAEIAKKKLISHFVLEPVKKNGKIVAYNATMKKDTLENLQKSHSSPNSNPNFTTLSVVGARNEKVFGKAGEISAYGEQFGTDSTKVVATHAGKIFEKAEHASAIVKSASWYEVGRNTTGVIFSIAGGAAGGLAGGAIGELAGPLAGGGMAIAGAGYLGDEAGNFGKNSYDNIMKNFFGVEDEAYGME